MKKFVMSVLVSVLAIVLSFIIITISVLAVLPISIDVDNTNSYALACVVVNVWEEANIVTVEDNDGMLWQFSGVDGWNIGDGCNLILDDNGTDEVFDDKIIYVRWFNLNELSNKIS